MTPPADHDADDLVVRAALGEPLTEDERRWLDADPVLQERVAEFVEIVDLARSDPQQVASDAEIDHLWSGIAAEAFGEGHQHDQGRPDHEGHEAPPPAAAGGSTSQRPGRAAWVTMASLGAAAAAVLAVVLVAPWSEPAPRTLAGAQLDPVGDAAVQPVEGAFVAAADGAQLRLDLSGLPEAGDAFYEVWLLDLDEGRLLSLGPVRPDGTYALPAGTRPEDFPTVDVSVEPHDGDPTHSGASVLRGPVQA